MPGGYNWLTGEEKMALEQALPRIQSATLREDILHFQDMLEATKHRLGLEGRVPGGYEWLTDDERAALEQALPRIPFGE